ncbi:MAG: DNA polymerase III subunit delta' [Nitrosomonas sp.]|nr:MAG: DNA polymerase III subunit delta' [Nitrosomonas sp.]
MMDFSHIVGNDDIKGFLQCMVTGERIGHSLLFAGRDGIGKGLFAMTLATELLGGEAQRQRIEQGRHPDVHVYRPEGKLAMHSIDTMRSFSDEIYLPPNEAPYKVFIVHDADRMLPTSANALLKTFEEPAPRTLIILLSGSPQAILPTVLSRCRKLYFQPIPSNLIATFLQSHHSCSSDDAQRIAAQASGSIGRALRLMQQQGDPKREVVLDILAKGKMATYGQLSQAVEGLHNDFEKLKEELAASCTGEMAPGGFDDLTAVQRDALQKEIDGAVTLRVREEIDALLEVLLAWYRDIELLHCGGNTELLTHPDRLEALHHALQTGFMRPVEQVQKAIADARINIARSSSIRSTLESLFLKLDLV